MKIDMLGKTFGQLTVLRFVGTKNNSRNLLWECTCTCGNNTITTGSRLRSFHTKSCGCLVPSKLRTRVIGWESGAQNNLYAQYKSNAKGRDLEFALSKDHFIYLTQENCYYCNCQPSNAIKYGNHLYKYNGLDRIDSSLGYIESNVLPCCIVCNTMKFDLPQNEFYNHIKNIILNRGL